MIESISHRRFLLRIFPFSVCLQTVDPRRIFKVIELPRDLSRITGRVRFGGNFLKRDFGAGTKRKAALSIRTASGKIGNALRPG